MRGDPSMAAQRESLRMQRPLLWYVLLVYGLAGASPAERPAVLSNGIIRAELGDRGLLSLSYPSLGVARHFEHDDFRVTLGGQVYESRVLPVPRRTVERERVTYAWTAGAYRLEVVYELRPEWQFLSKQVFVTSAPGGALRVQEIDVFRATLAETPVDGFVPGSARPQQLQTGDYGGALRFADGSGLLAVVQNPFLRFERSGSSFSLGYRPDMEWRMEYGRFAADRGLLAPYRLAGRREPAAMLPEWKLGALVAGGMDEAEIAAFTGMVRAFLLYHPAKPVNIFVGWTANDYQIDIATTEGREEYKRLFERAAELGAEHVLFAPSNSALSRRVQSVDDWSWEHVLWLGLGQKIRKNEWDPKTGAVPPELREMLDYAGARGLKLVAYVYPVLPFSHNREWLVAAGDDPARHFADLGVRSLQDWLIDQLVAFQRRTGISGYAFDHTFLTFDGTSRYAQWWGWRRVMEELRRRLPDLVIDGRQAYHLYGPWSWLAGSYPHPTFNDEQPESFIPFPDLHFDRVSANRERFTAYRYRNHEFAPSEIVPGFITHQTSRSDETGQMPASKTEQDVLLSRFRARDWDQLGWRYSLLSSIAVGGWNNVISVIPARDMEEFRHFPEQERRWFRAWLEWTERNREFLRHTRTILGQPALGKVDGTSAIVGDRGYVFLFNPNGRRLNAEFTLDSAIGLRGRRYLLRELHPQEGRLIGKPGAGVWSHGDRVEIALDGGSALVLEVQPAPATVEEPMLFSAPGAAELSGGVLRLSGVRGEVGQSQELLVLLPPGRAVSAVNVNEREVAFTRAGGGVVARVRFEGEPFRHYQQAGSYDPGFSGGTVSGSFTVPRRIFEQLAARQSAWPIPWTPEDYRSTWLAPQRLLLFVQIAEPEEGMDVRLKIDGQLVELRKAYSSIRPVRHDFVGFYADVSLLIPDRPYSFELELPPLRPGQFQGLFFENVETEYTSRIAP